VSTADPATPAPADRCPSCGAARTPPDDAIEAAALETAVEADTHCEWCGAEYEPPRRT
jgi:uncharacterized OB-fold protein